MVFERIVITKIMTVYPYYSGNYSGFRHIIADNDNPVNSCQIHNRFPIIPPHPLKPEHHPHPSAGAKDSGRSAWRPASPAYCRSAECFDRWAEASSRRLRTPILHCRGLCRAPGISS